MNDLIAVTVSTKYEDILDIILPQNYKFFKEWFIITHENDEATLSVIKKYKFDNVKVLYYDFYKDKCAFDKGSAVRYVQQFLQDDKYKNNIILLLDSDIYLPDNLIDLISKIDIIDNTLYGTEHRYDYYSYENFKKNKPDTRYKGSHEFYGYFQLYKNNSKYLYEKSENASKCDTNFKLLFKNKIAIKNLSVSHLGKEMVNWDGRDTKDDFII